jgi:acetylornithine deacetylase/succinyl-diaminopimelate desuccinylase-like protein
MTMKHSNYHSWYQQHADQIQEDFFTFLRFKSISADSAYNAETRKAADWLCSYLKKIGMHAELWETPGQPVVFASCMKAGPSKPTLLIYQHYDVQPVDPIELWKSDPFDPVIRNNHVYARGALDNKGQCFYSLTALKAFLELADQKELNIKVFIEGEEESGGGGTSAILPQKRKELAADHLLIVDMDLPEAGVPGINLGMRGILAMEVECKNSSIDLHSGTHGGIALNPNQVLVSLLARLWDDKGRVTIPGFYDDVPSVSKEELSRLHTHFDVDAYRKTFGVHAFGGEQGYSPIESNWIRPTLELNGIGGGYTGAGFKTVIPSKSTAKLSCRLVPHQNPDQIFASLETFLKNHAPKGIQISLQNLHGAPAFRSAFDAPIAQIAARAYEKVFEKPCRWLLCGASVPIVAELADASGAEVALIGMGLAEDNIHAPNEHFGMDRFEQGFLVMTEILTDLNS